MNGIEKITEKIIAEARAQAAVITDTAREKALAISRGYADKANEVRKILSAVKSQYDTFSGVLAKARKKIDEAGRSLEDAQHRNSIIQKKLKSIEEVSVGEADEILGIGEAQIDVADLDEE